MWQTGQTSSYSGLEECPLAEGIIKPQEGGFLGHPVFIGFPKGPSTLDIYSQLGSPCGHSVTPDSAFIPQLLLSLKNRFAEYRTHSRYLALSLEG